MEQIYKSAIEMCKYINNKLANVAKKDFYYQTEWTPYHFCCVRYLTSTKPDRSGACIEFSDHANDYTRIYADKVTHYGGWIGGPEVYYFNEEEEVWTNNGKQAPKYMFRTDMIREAILKWDVIKSRVDDVIISEEYINNFQV